MVVVGIEELQEGDYEEVFGEGKFWFQFSLGGQNLFDFGELEFSGGR